MPLRASPAPGSAASAGAEGPRDALTRDCYVGVLIVLARQDLLRDGYFSEHHGYILPIGQEKILAQHSAADKEGSSSSSCMLGTRHTSSGHTEGSVKTYISSARLFLCVDGVREYEKPYNETIFMMEKGYWSCTCYKEAQLYE
ncbi:hypothetical protein BTVI_129716 [Pitangus sulphuratus]|nr:hypothetical protein BTVI_129716 [Pitangus sulphuratus]